MTLLAICQIDIELGQVSHNLEKVREQIYLASEEGARLVVFPELSLTGYSFENDVGLEAIALTLDSRELDTLSQLCQKQKLTAVIGFIEQSESGLYNTAGVFGSGSTIPCYRKVHLPDMGVDRFLSHGNLGFPVFDLAFARIGINICYDQLFPESARSLAVQGAQIVIVPTCESRSRHEMSDILVRARAYENRVYYVWANRVGSENGSLFDGSSKVIDPLGEIVCLAGNSEEEIIYCEVEPALADDKRAFESRDYPEHQHNLFQDRSPQNYLPIVENSINNPD
ncbi:carbon-nitrogen hydrolase family protein [bacterium]|nr:carbon-nitrogen hydrolase family protein [bacterium]